MLKAPEAARTLHISRSTYDVVHDALVELLERHGAMTYSELVHGLKTGWLAEQIESPEWYTVVVKLHMEASGELESLTNCQPERVRLALPQAC